MWQIFSPVVTEIEQNLWVENIYTDRFGQEQPLSFLALIIPGAQEGALENLLMEAISEDPYDREIVTRSAKFIEEVSPYAQKYIKKRRLKLKARLGVTWAIQSPEKSLILLMNRFVR